MTAREQRRRRRELRAMRRRVAGTVVIAFYFGTQTQKISDAVAQSEEGKE